MGRKQPEKILNQEEQIELLKGFNKNCPTGLRDYVMCRLMLDAGLRVSETRNLEMGHIDFMTYKVFIKESKGAKDRTIWVNDDIMDVIQDWIDVRKQMIKNKEVPDPLEVQKKEYVPKRKRKDYVFITFKGRPVYTSQLRRKVKKVANEVNIQNADKVHPHTLRHTYATDFYRETNNIRKVQDNLGHSDVSTTEIYTTIVDEDRKKSSMEFQENRRKNR